jgi:hypothetical protein
MEIGYITKLFYRWRLKNKKKRALFEVLNDLDYLRKFKLKKMIDNEGEMRKKIAEENKKPEKKRDVIMIQGFSQKLALKQKLKKEISDLEQLQTGLQDYIELLYE